MAHVTRTDLVNEITATLYSHGKIMDHPTWLTAAIDASTTTIPVASTKNVSIGLAEIEDETVWVDSMSGNTLTLAPFGRGYQGTTAATHAQNVALNSNPTVSRKSILTAINNAVDRLFPTLYRVRTHTFTMDGVAWAYDLPADAEGILKVEWQPLANVDKVWPEIYMYQYDANSGASATEKAIVLGEPPQTGSTVRVTYKANFGTLSSPTTTLHSIGAEDSYRDLLTYSCVSDLLRSLESARTRLKTVENVSRAQVVETGAAADAANSYYAMYQQRLAEERRSLLLRYPVSMKFQR